MISYFVLLGHCNGKPQSTIIPPPLLSSYWNSSVWQPPESYHHHPYNNLKGALYYSHFTHEEIATMVFQWLYSCNKTGLQIHFGVFYTPVSLGNKGPFGKSTILLWARYWYLVTIAITTLVSTTISTIITGANPKQKQHIDTLGGGANFMDTKSEHLKEDLFLLNLWLLFLMTSFNFGFVKVFFKIRFLLTDAITGNILVIIWCHVTFQ